MTTYQLYLESGPRHRRGLVPGVEGLAFVGLPFQTSLSSSLLGGVGADARYLTSRLAHRTMPARTHPPHPAHRT